MINSLVVLSLLLRVEVYECNVVWSGLQEAGSVVYSYTHGILKLELKS